jgi:hypothetical protein
MSILRRTLLMLALIFWQGGFMFYGGIVIPTGARVLEGGHRTQSAVTRAITPVLHAAGGVGVVLLLWDLLAGAPYRRGFRWILLLGIAAMLAAEVVLTYLMETSLTYPDRPHFSDLHRAYVLAGTAQWLLVMGSLPLILLAWRNEDQTSKMPDNPSRTAQSA